MPSETETGAFLKDFKEKMKFRDVLFRDDRGKNAKALLELELRPMDRKAILEALEVRDYSEGPNKDQLYGGSDLWVFGKTVKKKEVYIKISMGAAGSGVICISFHLAEHKMNYPFK
ncbi:MAG: toxin [Bacteroidota bacterium]